MKDIKAANCVEPAVFQKAFMTLKPLGIPVAADQVGVVAAKAYDEFRQHWVADVASGATLRSFGEYLVDMLKVIKGMSSVDRHAVYTALCTLGTIE